MGLFSSSYKSYASAASSPLVEEKYYVNTQQRLILDAIRNNDDIVAGIKASNLLGFNFKIRQYISYARRAYVHGLPTNDFLGYQVDRAKLQQYLTDNVDPGAVLSSVYLGPMQVEYWREYDAKRVSESTRTALQTLLNNGGSIKLSYYEWNCYWVDLGDNGGYQECGWHLKTKIATNLNFFHVWDKNQARNFAPVRSGIPTSGQYSYGPASLYTWNGRQYQRTSCTTDFDGNTYCSTVTDFTAAGVPAGDWLQAEYILYNPDGTYKETRYFLYKWGSGKPELDFPKNQKASEFLPVAVLRTDTVNYNKDEDSDEAITTNRLLKKLDIDGDEVLDKVYEQITSKTYEDENGDEQEGGNLKPDEFWDMYIGFGVPIKTTYLGSIEYMFRFFEFLQGYSRTSMFAMALAAQKYQDAVTACDEQNWGSSDNYEPCFVSNPMEDNFSRFKIQEAGARGYNTEFRWLFIHEQRKTGNLHLKKGRYAYKTYTVGSTTSLNALKQFMPDEQANALNKLKIGSYLGSIKSFPIGFMVLQKQVTETKIDQILVFGLEQGYQINTKDGTKAAVFQLGDPDTRDQFYFPISIGIYQQMSARREEELLYNSFRTDVFIVKRVKIRWYQKGFFKFLFMVLAVVAIIYLGPIMGTLMEAALAGSFAAMVKLVALQIVLSAFIGFVTGQVLGGKLGMIFGMMLMFIGPAAAGNLPTSISQAFGSMFNSPLQFLQTVTKLAKIGVDFYTQAQLKGLQQDMQNLGKSYKEKQQELQDAYDGLTSNANMPVWSIMREPEIYFPESSDQFLARSLDPNPGMMTFYVIENFVALCLKLPDKPGEPNFLESVTESMSRGDEDGWL